MKFSQIVCASFVALAVLMSGGILAPVYAQDDAKPESSAAPVAKPVVQEKPDQATTGVEPVVEAMPGQGPLLAEPVIEIVPGSELIASPPMPPIGEDAPCPHPLRTTIVSTGTPQGPAGPGGQFPASIPASSLPSGLGDMTANKIFEYSFKYNRH